MSGIVPVVLCGGSGTRLWPLSRQLHPKQFIPFAGDTLFGRTLDRVSALCGPNGAVIVCNEEHRFFVAAIMGEKHCSGPILLEPEGKNTAPAIGLAALAAMDAGNDPVLLVLPSDHLIKPHQAFADAVDKGLQGAREGLLVTFGIPPTRPETGYGYIRQGEELAWGGYSVARFVEKPDSLSALSMLSDASYAWNSGIFMFKASVYMRELGKHAPAMCKALHEAWDSRSRDGLFTRFSPQAFQKVPADSIDYAMMEKTDLAAMVRLEAHWNDLGSWSAFYEEADHDENGNALVGDAVVQNARGCYVHSTNRLVAAIDVEGVAVVETPDAVLVMDRNKTQGVKTLLESLKSGNRPEAASHLSVYRPWGNYQVLAGGDRFQVKRIVVDPGASLSAQFHHHRAEHWIVVSGTAKVCNGDTTLLLAENQSTYIPVGAVHRLENPGKVPLVLIEIQSGSYLGEDDIVRLDDNYGRE